MKIGQKELKDIQSKAKKKKLESIMTEDYPNAEIFIIRGYDRFSYEHYTRGAYFDKTKAYSEMNKIPPNGSPTLCDTYHVYSETPAKLNHEPWDSIDRMMIYDKLEENYFKR